MRANPSNDERPLLISRDWSVALHALEQEHLVGLPSLRAYFNSDTTITDRTPELLSQVSSLEHITFDNCHRLTNTGISHLSGCRTCASTARA